MYKKNVYPVLPSSRGSASNGGAKLPCICGCGELTSSRFRPGHDGRLNGWVNGVLSGRLQMPEFEPLRRAITVEISLREAAGVEGKEHAHHRLLITREALESGAKRVKAKAKPKARLVRKPKPEVAAPAADIVSA